MTAKPRVGLSVWLALLVIGAVVPLLCFAGAALFQISKDSQASKDRGQIDTTRALAQAVDGEVRSWKSALMALAASHSLQQGRLAEFYEEARRVALQHEGWIVLTDATGKQLLNTLRQYGDPLPATSSPEAIGTIFTEGKPIVTDVFIGKVSQRYVVAVGVPVLRNGKVAYALDLTFSPERLTKILTRQQLPASWVGAINDRQHRVVTRSRDAQSRIGKPVVDWLATATEDADSGIMTGHIIDGRLAQATFQRMQEVPWIVVLAIPVAELPSSTPLVLFLVVGAAMICAAVGLALYTGRKITGPIGRLAEAGGALVRGEAVEIGPPADIREVQELQRALGEASAAVQGYYQERERAAVAVETAKVATAAEQALRASEERLRLFIRNAPAAIAMFDRDMRYLAVSRRWLTDYGLGDRDILGLSHYAVFPEISDAWKQVHRRALAGEVIQATDDRFERLDGSVQWLRWEVRPWHAGDGTVGGIILYTEDITDRKRAEEQIRSLAKFPGENPFPVLRTAVDGTILYANLASLPLLQTWETGEGQMLPRSWRESVQQVYTAGLPREVEVTSGERVFSIVLVPIRDAGYVNLYGRDITARKQAEFLSRALNAIDGIVHSTLDFDEVMHRAVSEAAKAMRCETAAVSLRQADGWIVSCVHGFSEEVIGKQMSDEEEPHAVLAITEKKPLAIPDAYNDERVNREHMKKWGIRSVLVVPLILKAEAVGVMFYNYHKAAVAFSDLQLDFATRLAGSIALALENARLLRAVQEELIERKRAEAALRKAHDELELRVQERTAELSKAIQTLEKQSEQLHMLASELTLTEQRERRRLATVLHDEHQQLLVGAKLRMGPLERVEDPTVREGVREVNALLEEAIEHARSLTRELSPPILQAGGLIPALDWLAGWMGEKHHLHVDVRTDETAVPDTEDMRILLFQSVRELLFNVVKHAKVPTARVETTRQEGEVRIVVSDAGVGFDPASLRIEDGRASGFGLFSIRQRLELLGGRLDISSTPNQGSRITLWAPLRPAEAPALQAPKKMDSAESAAVAAGPQPAPDRTGKIRVLVVDDHKVVRQGLARLLASEPDIEIVGEAADGRAAVEQTRQLSPDVVLMDISMPIMNGIEATRAIRTECPAARVIGLSMFEEAERAQAMRDAGAVRYLTKSAASDTLVAAIRECAGPQRESQTRAAPSK